MFARVSTYPPLDHESVVASDHVVLHALIESSSPEDDWEVQLWHNHFGAERWQALDFERINPLISRSAGSKLCYTWYAVELQPRSSGLGSSTSFTVRFRRQGSASWRWIRDATGSSDGKLLFQQGLPERPVLDDYLAGLSSDIKAQHVPSETPDTIVWSLEAPAAPAHGSSSGVSAYLLGQPTSFCRWFSLVRLWTPWLAPRQGRGLQFAHEDAVLYAFQRHDGLYLLVLAVSGLEDIISVLQNDHGKLRLSARNDREATGTSRAVVTLGLSLDTALAAAVYEARKTVTKFAAVNEELETLLTQMQHQITTEKDVKADWVENWYDCLSYCTWNSLGRSLTQDRILDALDSLKNSGIAITTLIIDDNWQSLDKGKPDSLSTGWTDFDAHDHGFPNGLKSSVSAIRQKHPHIAHVAVWHALLGYWGGISPNGNIAKKYKTRLVHKGPIVKGGTMTVVDVPDVKPLYNDFYAFLSDAGIDGVKTDVQFMLDEIQDAPARRQLTAEYLNEWSISHLRHFGGRAISCMSQAPTILFHSQLPTNMPPTVVRNSDDFFPNVDDSHAWHIFCNAHNAIFTKYLNVIPDWDMFQTHHPWGRFHAAARCLSGGPIYITDEPGKHDAELIHEVSARTGRGGTVVLRPRVVGRSLEAFVGFEADRLVLIGAYDGLSVGGSSFIGAFNCRDHSIAQLIHLNQFLGTGDGDWLIRSHTTGQLGHVISSARPKTAVESIAVDGRSWQILTARPVTTLSIADSTVRTADFGLIDKMTGAAAIIASHTTASADGERLHLKTTLKALGQWGIWVEALHKPQLSNMLVLLEGQVVPPATVAVQGDGLVVVDVTRAWDELGLHAQYVNEVHVEALVGV